MEQFYRRAIQNIVRHGDTDIFPFPIENHILHDKPDAAVALMASLDADIKRSLAEQPPSNVGALAPVGYTGFRWATQIDPLWNALYLSWVLALADRIEAARQPIEKDRVFSYRYAWNEEDATCFRREVNWRSFIEKALEKSSQFGYVVSCDISEFYLRINHHRIENALMHIDESDYSVSRIRHFLSNLSNTYSFGLPVGGPASRIISELVLSQIDSLLVARGIEFVRYADDYYLFAETPDQAFRALVTLTQLLIDNQGLQLQKSKTRIMSSAEFSASNPLVHDDEVNAPAPLGEARQALLSINMHFDPYSPTAQADYLALKSELDRYPIMEIIRAELTKSRVDVGLARRLISIVRYLDGPVLDDAVKTIIENDDILYPVYYNVLICVKEVFDKISPSTQEFVLKYIQEAIQNSSRVMIVELNIQYAVRLLSMRNSEETRAIFYQLFDTANDAVRRDIILALARWHDWHWLSDVRNRFRNLSDVARRGFIVASYCLADEGEHWRKHIKRELSPFEQLVSDWSKEKHNLENWAVPL
jgi:hypothetical protein